MHSLIEKMRNSDPVIWVVGVILVAVVILIPVGLYYAAKDQSQWEDWCRDQGGRVDKDSKTSTVTTYDSKGRPSYGTSTSTTYYCLSKDGGILDVK